MYKIKDSVFKNSGRCLAGLCLLGIVVNMSRKIVTVMRTMTCARCGYILRSCRRDNVKFTVVEMTLTTLPIGLKLKVFT